MQQKFVDVTRSPGRVTNHTEASLASLRLDRQGLAAWTQAQTRARERAEFQSAKTEN
jgi:hypothetical protein